MMALGIISAGLGAASSIMEGQAQSKGASMQAQNALYAQQSAKINAAATDAYYRDDLRTTLSNITAIRAASGMGDSPTSQAIAQTNTDTSDMQRTAKVTSYLTQAKQEGEAVNFYHSAAKQYIGLGFMNAASGIVKGIGSSPSFQKWIGG